MSGLLVDRRALESMMEWAQAAAPRETGGLLLGHFQQSVPVVVQAPEIHDSRATRVRYRRDVSAAGVMLARARREDSTSLIGYLGEWHTHPLPIGPSRRDRRAIAVLANSGDHDVFLVVLVAGRRGWTPSALGVSADGVFTDLDATILEGSL